MNERRYIVEVVEVSTLHFKYLQNQSRGVLDVIDLKTNKILACWENHESYVYFQWNMMCACENIQLHEPYELWRKKHQKTPECPNQRIIHREKTPSIFHSLEHECVYIELYIEHSIFFHRQLCFQECENVQVIRNSSRATFYPVFSYTCPILRNHEHWNIKHLTDVECLDHSPISWILSVNIENSNGFFPESHKFYGINTSN